MHMPDPLTAEICRPRILVVDDDSRLRQQIAESLAGEYEVDAATTGDMALRLANQQRPALVVCNLDMPGMDGLAVLNALRASAALRTTPVMFLSADASEEYRIEGFENGADDYLAKPFTVRELKTRLRAVLEAVSLHEPMPEPDGAASVDIELVRARAQILDSITDAIFALDKSWCFSYVNQHAVDHFGSRREELIGRLVWTVLPSNQARLFESHYQEVARTGKSAVFEVMSAPGQWLEVNVYPWPEGVAVFMKDISARRRAEEAQRESEARFQLLANSIPQLVWIARPDGSVHWYNQRWHDYTGTTPAQVQGWGWQVVHDPSLLPKVLAKWRHAIEAGESLEMIFPLRGADGRFRRFLTRVEPLRDAAGNIMLWFGTSTDVEDQFRQQDTFRMMADSAPVLIWIADVNNNRTWVNRSWLEFTGRELAQELGKSWIGDIHEEDLDRCLKVCATTFAAHTKFTMEYRLRRRDGQYRWVLESGIPLFEGPNQVFSGYIGSCVDIHELRILAQERELLLEAERGARADAERLSQLKDEFLANVSHELRTPLNAMLGWANVLRRMHANPTQLTEGLEAIERNARAQARIISDLLDMSRIVSGKVHLELQELDLHQVINESIDVVRPAAAAKQIRIVTVLDAHVGVIRGDPSRLQQVLWNLLTNAVKFTPHEGRIAVRLERVSANVEVSVEDSGQGIEPEFLPFVFDRFRQADGSITRRAGGLGLGLSIVKSLVELHGGSVRAKSPGLGQGSTFIVALPVVAMRTGETGTHRALSLAASGEPLELPMLAGVRLLVVDDEADARALVAKILEERGAEVVCADSGPQALATLAERRFDILVSDIGMPDMDGYQLIRRVHAMSQGAKLPAIALTAFARAEDRQRALLAGYQMHLSKPLQPEELIAGVASLMRLTEEPQRMSG
jgi:PAS domain S-box-containing protein